MRNNMSFKGKTHSEETKRKQAISKMGDGNPAKRPEVRKKISAALKIAMNKPDYSYKLYQERL
jgi:hypothetical protein